MYRRWWFIGGAIVVVVVVLASLGGNDPDADAEAIAEAAADTTSTGTPPETTTLEPEDTTTTADATTTTAAETTTTTRMETTTTSTTTTTVPPTTTTTAPAWEASTVEGQGDDVIDFSVPDGDAAVLELSHSGSSNFAVISYSTAGERIDLLVNEIGAYQGRRPVNFVENEIVGELEITADGPWAITTHPLDDMPVMNDGYDGSGDEVLLYSGTESRLTATHVGESNFVILAWGTGGRDLLVNEIGAYEGTVRIDPSALIIEVQADGQWSLTTG